MGEIIQYQIDGKNFKGYIARPTKADQKQPAVIVAHAWRGQDDFARQKADQLADLGYIGFAADMYGDGISVSNEEAPGMMLPLFTDRKLLRERIVKAYDVIKTLPGVDENLIGAIGFCFGGLTVIELLRSGANLKGVVSFHGVLGDNMMDHKANLAPKQQKTNGSLLILHGHDDPLVSTEDIANMQKEMTDASVDWQMHVYGNTSHAFSNPDANDPNHGLSYNPIAAKRSWQSMINFFQERFKT